MNDVPQSAPDVVAEPARLGKGLADAREACGFSVSDIARQLRLSPVQVEALESGDYQRLPGPVFVRGFMRNYARIVNLDPAPLIAAIAEHLPDASAAAPGLTHSVEIPFPTGRAFPVKRFALAGLLVVAALGVYEFYPDPAPESAANPDSVKLSPAVATVEERAVTTEAGAAQQPAIESAATVVQMAGDGSAPADKEKTASDATVSAARPAAVAPAKAEHLVRLNFERDAWVEIRDRYGNKIFSQLNPAGTEQAVSGVAPLSVVVGNANAVRLFHNERRVDLAPYVKVDVARLTLE